MNTSTTFTDYLTRYADKYEYTGGQLARLTGLPRRTVANWLDGQVRQPRYVEDVLKLSNALRLSRRETDTLLNAAGFPVLIRLMQQPHSTEINDLLSLRRQDVPFQVPARVSYFVGRERELDRVYNTLKESPRQCSIPGMGGIGKTVLAIEFAHRHYDEFPDGVLWISATAGDVLSMLMTAGFAYGHDVSTLNDVEGRAAAIRSLLATKQALLIIDDVQTSDVLRYLVPGGDCAVLITTRQRNLSALAGTLQIELSPLTADSMTLFEQFLPVDVVATNRETVEQLIDALGYLPLAVTLAASRIAYEPGWTIPQFWQVLQQQMSRLSLLAYDDHSVQSTLHISYQALSDDEQQAFAALGLFHHHDFDIDWSAAVTARDDIQAILRRLYSLSLVQHVQGTRYKLHPLVAAFARDRQTETEGIHRFVSYAVQFVKETSSFVKVDRAYPHLQAALEYADANSRYDLVRYLYPYWDARGIAHTHQHWLNRALNEADLSQVHSLQVLQARLAMKKGEHDAANNYLQQALQSDDGRVRSQAYNGLGIFYMRQGDYEKSRQAIEQSLDVVEAEQHVEGIIACRINLMAVYFSEGDYEAALTQVQRGLSLIEELPDTDQKASPIKALHSKLWMNYGVVRGQQGDYAAEAEAYEISLALAEQIEHQEMLAMLHSNLAELAATQGHLDEAIEHIQRTLEIAQAAGDRENIAVAFIALGDYAMQQNDMETAQLHLLNGLNEARRISSLHLALRARLKLGEWHMQQDEPDAAKQAFDIVKRHTVERPDDDAAALYGLARVALAQSDPESARQQAMQSLTIYERTGSAQADVVREWLDNISD